MKKRIFTVGLALCQVFAVFAEDVKSVVKVPSLADTISINELVVTGTRIPSKRSNVAQRIEMVTPQQIEILPTKDLTNAIKTVTGVNIIDYGGMLSGISIRGFRPEFDNLSGRSTVLIDGRPAAGSNLALIDVANAEKIEILRGPASSVYGPTAMGGVVNIITKKSRGDINGKVEAGVGSFGYNFFSGSVGGAIPATAFDFDLSANREARGDFKTGKGNLFRGWLGGDKAQFKTSTLVNNAVVDKYEMRDDARGDGEKIGYSSYSRTSYKARAGYKISDDWRLNLYYDGSYAGNVESPADIMKVYMPTKKKLQRNGFDASVDGKVGRYALFARAYYGNQESNSIEVFDWEGNKLDKEFTSYQSKFDWKGAQLNTTANFKNVLVTLGADYSMAGSYNHRWDDAGVEIAPYSLNYTLGNFGVYNQTKISLLDERLIGTIGLRYDINDYKTKTNSFDATKKGTSKSNTFFSPSLGLKYKITDDFHLNSTYGRGFSYANPFHLTGYWEKVSADNPSSVVIDAGNPHLDNQESNTWDAGFTFVKPKLGLLFEATYFNTALKNSSVAKYYTVDGSLEAVLKSHEVPFVKDGNTYKTLEGKTIVGFSSYENAYKSYLEGLEFSLAYDFGALANFRYSLEARLGYVQMLKMEEEYQDMLGKTASRSIYNVSKNTINYGLTFSNRKNFTVGLNGRFLGYRYDNDWSDWMNPAEVRYPKVMTMDLFATLDVYKGISCSLFVNNLTDENYYEKRDYNLPGRNFNFKVGFKF